MKRISGASRSAALAVSLVTVLALPFAGARVLTATHLADPAEPAPAATSVDLAARQQAESRSKARAFAANSNTKATPKATPPEPRKKRPLPRPAGVADSCPMTRAFPQQADAEEIRRGIQKHWKVELIGQRWAKPANREVLRTLWQTLDAIDCTPFLATIAKKHDGRIALSGEKTGSWAWGDYGLSRPDVVSLDLGKLAKAVDQGQEARVTRVLVHEMAHAWSVDRGTGGYFGRFEKLARKQSAPGITQYGAQNSSENFAEAVGYYVARCAWEQNDNGLSEDNPYDARANAAYHGYMKKTVFGGRTFGPAAGSSC